MRAAFNKPSKRPKREVRKFSFDDFDISNDSSCKKEISFLLFDICIYIYLILISINSYIDIIYFYKEGKGLMRIGAVISAQIVKFT